MIVKKPKPVNPATPAPPVPVELDAQTRAALTKLIGSPELVELVRIECSTWAWVDSIVTRPRPAVRPAAVVARDELRRLQHVLERTMNELQQVSDSVSARIEDAARSPYKSTNPLGDAVAALTTLRTCIRSADHFCGITIAGDKATARSLREHLLISMVLPVLPAGVVSRSTASNSKLVRVLALLYRLVGLPLNEEDLLSRPRDHLKTYFDAWGEDRGMK